MKELIKNGKRHAYLYKGNTLIWEKGKNSYTYVRYRGQQITAVNTVNAPISEAVLNGQTLVNFHKKQTYKLHQSVEAQQVNKYENIVIEDNHISCDMVDGGVYGWGSYMDFGFVNVDMLKPNTKYLVWFELATVPVKYSVSFRDKDSSNPVGAVYDIPKGQNYAILTTTDEIIKSSQILYVNFYQADVGHYEFKNAMIIEYVEGMENWDIPYFEGMASVQAPTVQTVGKNLYNPRTAYLDEANNQFIYNMIDLNPNSMYSFYAKGNVISFELYNDNNQSTGGIDESASLNRINFGTSSKEVKVKLGFYNGTTNGIEDVDFSNVQLQEGSVFTQYEQHKFNQLATSEEVVLRSLPNGVCDTYNTRTKEYVRRIGEVTYTGEDVELWKESVANFESDDIDSFYIYIFNPYAPIKSKYGNCNLFPTYHSLPLKPKFEYFHILNAGQSQIVVGIKRNKLSSQNLTGFKQWLSKNPLTVQYELATPVVTAVQPQITDQNGNTINSLYAFNDTTHIKTGSAALLPTVDVEVPSTVEMFLHNQREANEGTVYL